MVRCRCKQFSEALTCCDNALNLDQDYVSAMKMRATCKMELFDFDGACKDWKWVVRSASFDSDDRESTREQYRLARRYRNASHYDILGITKVASHKDIIKVVGSTVSLPSRHGLHSLLDVEPLFCSGLSQRLD